MSVSEKIVEVKMQRDLFGRLIYIAFQKLLDIDKVLSYFLSPIPLSMCHMDGSIDKTNKSAIFKLFEQQITSEAPERYSIKVYIH